MGNASLYARQTPYHQDSVRKGSECANGKENADRDWGVGGNGDWHRGTIYISLHKMWEMLQESWEYFADAKRHVTYVERTGT